MPVDLERFTRHLRAQADVRPPGHGQCGLFVRRALQAGGANFHGSYPPKGKLYGPALEALGFHRITVEDPDTFHFLKGDVMVMDPYIGSTNDAGHVAGYDGRHWIQTSYKTTSGPDPDTVIKDRGQTMPSTAINRTFAALLFTVSTTTFAAASDKPPRFLTVPVLGLRLPLNQINVEAFPDDLRAKCEQVEDEYRTSRLWIFGRAADAARKYYVLTGYTKRLHPEPGQRLYDSWEDGVVFTAQGDKCGGDGATETFETHDPNADDDGNVPIPILRELAVDLAARTLRAFGGADRLRTEIKNQRIDFNQLPSDLQEVFKPYFDPAK